MAISVVQTKLGTRTNVSLATDPNNAMAFDSNVVAGNRITITASVVFGSASNVPTLTISDSQGLSWTSYGGTVQGRTRAYIFTAIANSSAALTTTITASGSDTSTACGLIQGGCEDSGDSGIEDSGSATANSANANSGGATIVNNGLFVAASSRQGVTGTEEGGWTVIGSSSSQRAYFAYKYVTGGSGGDDQFDLTSASANWSGVIVAIHEPTAGGVIPVMHHHRQLIGAV